MSDEQEMQPHPDTVPAGTSEADIACVPPPPPPVPDLTIAENSGPVLRNGDAQALENARRLWLFLQQETYRQRGEGFRRDWAFHIYAANHKLGAPLARSARRPQWVQHQGKAYGFQPFARDTLFNEIPRWSLVQELSSLLDATIPADEDSLARLLLAASYETSGGALHEEWAFHQFAVRHRLGPPLGRSERLTVRGEPFYVQVFARDTLYSTVERPGEVGRLSEAREEPLRAALWTAVYQQIGSTYQPASPFHKFGVGAHLGSPLTGVYQASCEGNEIAIQVFALDTLYALPDSMPALQSALPIPATFAMRESVEPVLSMPDDALSTRRPVFNILPVAGQPRISQFYGYTRFAAGAGEPFYRATQGRHSGVDFAVPVGTPLLAIDHGLVVWAGPNVNGLSFGAGPRSVIVRYGSVYALYGHVLSESVRAGEGVTPGQEIARSGFPSAPHLHFEVRPVPERMLNNDDPDQRPVNPGYAVNPIDYFSADLMGYFLRQLARLGGNAHFCRGMFTDQERITFGAPVDNRPCT